VSEKKLNFSTTKIRTISDCPASLEKGKTLTPRTSLTRWERLNDAIVEWLINEAPEDVAIEEAEKNFSYFDQLQQKILKDLFSRFRDIYDKNNSSINVDYPNSSISKFIDDEEVFISAYTQYEILDDNSTEYIKLKVGKTGVSDLDKAIIQKTKVENETFYVADLQNNELSEIDTVDNPDEIIDESFKFLDKYLSGLREPTPGNHCSMCSRTAVCGQYPVIGGEQTKQNYRGILISKTNLQNKDNCERQLAWKTLFHIPKEERDYESSAGIIGTKFHEYSQSMLVNNKHPHKQGELSRLKDLLINEDQEISEMVLRKYQQLLSEIEGLNNLEITLSEHALGFTCITDGLVLNVSQKLYKGKVATTFMGKADLLGRLDGIPLVVELKTGAQSPEHAIEAKLYALGALIQTKEDEVVVLHIYANDKDKKTVERRFTLKQFDSLVEEFQLIAEKVGNWDPSDSLQPKYNVGEWCNFCDFQNTCVEFR